MTVPGRSIPEHDLREVLSTGAALGREILVYGTGSRCLEVLELLEGANLRHRVVGFMDSNTSGEFLGLPLHRFDDLPRDYLCERWVVVASCAHMEIINSLIAVGVDDYAVFLTDGECDLAYASDMDAAVGRTSQRDNRIAGIKPCETQPSCPSCAFLDHSMILGNVGLHPCCFAPPIATYTDIDAVLDRFMQFRTAIYNRLATGRDCFCRNCSYLDAGRSPSLDGPLKTFSFDVPKRCNFACSYCRVAKNTGRERPEVPLRFITALFDRGYLGRDVFFNWAGEGEPTMYPHFETITRSALDAGATGNVYTNSSIYSEVIAQGLESGMLSLITSLDAGTRGVFRRIKGVDCFDTVERNLSRYIERGPNQVTIKYLLIPENSATEEVDAFLDVCVRLGVKRIEVCSDHHQIDLSLRKAYQHLCREAGERDLTLEKYKFIPWD